jgi:hypothetical protein
MSRASAASTARRSGGDSTPFLDDAGELVELVRAPAGWEVRPAPKPTPDPAASMPGEDYVLVAGDWHGYLAKRAREAGATVEVLPEGVTLEGAGQIARRAIATVLGSAADRTLKRAIEDAVRGHGRPVFYDPDNLEAFMRDRTRAAQKAAAPPPPAASAPPTPPKDTMRTGPALKSWEDAPKATAARIRTALSRAEKNSEHRAGVALGRRRLEIRQAGGVFDIFDGKSGEPFPYAKKGPRPKRAARAYSTETPATLKRRLSRERDAETRKSAAAERKTKRKATGAKKKATRAELAAKTKEARNLCKIEVQEARTKAPRPKKRLAVAIARTRCAARQTGIERSFFDRLASVETELAQYRGRAPKAHSAEPRAVPGKKREAREERDDSVRSELQRQGRAELIATWNRVKDGPKFRGLSADRAWEAFSEFLEADEGNTENQARAAAQRSDADHQCAQAQHLGREDPQVALWASENCEDDRAKRPAKSAKLSPARRTLTMLDLPNPAEFEERRAAENAAAARRAPKAPKATRAARGQQSLGSTWTPLVDAGGSQMSLGGRRASRGSDSPVPF